MRRTNKLFLIILPILLVGALSILNLSFKIFQEKLASSGCGCDFKTASGEFDPKETVAVFMDNYLNPPLLAFKDPVNQVLGDISPDDKWVEVDLSDQKLIAWQGSEKFMETLISSGKWGKTPTGEYAIWSKYKYTKMSGGNKEDHTYYYLPNVPYTMYFYKGFGLHGTYWHNNFGTPMSHGCVNMPTVMAEKLFYWATPVLPAGKNSITADSSNPGTRVVIHD